MKQSFGREKVPYFRLISIDRSKWKSSMLFVILLIIGLLGFSLHYRVSSFFFDNNKIDIVQHQLGDIANYIALYDKSSARIIAQLDAIIQSAQLPGNFLSHQSKQIELLRDDIITTQKDLNKSTKNKYKTVTNIINDLRPMSTEIMKLLGKDQEIYYLVILQNSAESRPNGGFFGSFAVISLYQGKIHTLHLIDSYLPQKYINNINVRLPDWSNIIYPDKSSTRIAANKFGFHNEDGKILMTLYDQTFNQKQTNKQLPSALCKDICNKKITGVIFLKTDLFTTILPDFTKKQREWQFLNANIDLIRGANLPNKKQKYLLDLKKFLEERKGQLIKRFFGQFEKLTSHNYLGIYIPSTSSELQSVLERYNLVTMSPKPEHHVLYFWDTNTSFNKINTFVDKHIIIKNNMGDIILETSDTTLAIDKLKKGSYTLQIIYDINVPEHYKKFIFGLESQYKIQMTDRERGILALEATDNYPDLITRLRSTRSQIYYPNDIEITMMGGDGFQIVPFSTPRGKGLQYKMETANNNTTSTVTFGLKKL